MPNRIAAALCGEREPGLLGSYVRALRVLGWTVACWDVNASQARHTKFGRLGSFATSFLPVDAWTLKANREMLITLAEPQPELVIVSGNAPVRAGALAQLRILAPGARLVLLWPDSLLNLSRHVIEALPVYDLVASYSKASLGELRRLGATRVEWLPFGADPLFFPPDVPVSEEQRRRLASDVCLVGNHRPEREAAVLALVRAGFSVKVWGEPRSWKRHVREPGMLSQYYQGEALFGEHFARALRCSALSLNPIDPTNFPSANMRFFESPGCGAATLNSPCPEMAGTFREGVSGFYFDTVGRLPGVVKELIADEPRRIAVAKTAQKLVLDEHTYARRAEQLLELLGDA